MLRHSLLLAAALLASAPGGAYAQQRQLDCQAGPLHRDFGGTHWLVYGCDDGKSLVVVSDAGNPASPFYFVLAWSDAGYGVSGEGNGSQAASDAALHDLQALTTPQISRLFAETQATGTAPKH